MTTTKVPLGTTARTGEKKQEWAHHFVTPFLFLSGINALVRLQIDRVIVQCENRQAVTSQIIQSNIGPAEIVIAVDRESQAGKTAFARQPFAVLVRPVEKADTVVKI